MNCGTCGFDVPSDGRFCPSCGAQVAIPATPIHAQGEVDIEVDEAPVEETSRARTGSDVPQVSFVMWGWGCLGILSMIAHGFAAALLALFLVLGGVAATEGKSILNEDVLTAGGIALGVVVLTRMIGRVRVHMGVDPSLDELWLRVGEEVRSMPGAGQLAGFELDVRTRTRKVRRKGRTRTATSTVYVLMAVLQGGRRRRVPHLPEMGWWSGRRSLGAGKELLSLLGRPQA